jgi:hypothetical protein
METRTITKTRRTRRPMGVAEQEGGRRRESAEGRREKGEGRREKGGRQ